MATEKPSIISVPEALDRLRAGNRRFASGLPSSSYRITQTRRSELVREQMPFAIVLGCSDSRVPTEIVFDQGLGDLFVIRVAGNIVTPPLAGSVELAVERFGTPLVVVLGHSHCGAVRATLSELEKPNPSLSPNLRSLVDCIRPTLEPLLADHGESRLPEGMTHLLARAVRANIRASTEQLRRSSESMSKHLEGGELAVVGAEYSLETGLVDFFDTAPEES